MLYIDDKCDFDNRKYIIIGGEKKYRVEDFGDSKALGNKPYFGLVPWLINKTRDLPCPEQFKVMPYEVAKNNFSFHPNHPVKNMAYGACYIYPNLYVPISYFHNHMQKLKCASFVELCANLGAKEVFVEDSYVDEKKVDLSAEIPETIANLGIGYKNESGVKMDVSFSENNKGIKPYESPWIDTEPTWKAMINTRKNNFTETFNCELSYIEDFGINMSLASKLNSCNIDIGGKFESMKKINIKYKVTFW